MHHFDSNVNFLIQVLLVLVIALVFNNLLITTRLHGEGMRKSVRLLGIGILFISISVIEVLLINFSILEPDLNLSLLKDSLSLVGLIFLAKGFSTLTSTNKA